MSALSRVVGISAIAASSFGGLLSGCTDETRGGGWSNTPPRQPVSDAYIRNNICAGGANEYERSVCINNVKRGYGNNGYSGTGTSGGVGVTVTPDGKVLLNISGLVIG